MVIHHNTQVDLSFSIDWLYFVVVYKDDLICNSVFIETTTRKIETMIRYEAKTPHKAFVGCEDTIEEAKAYIQSLIDCGVEILKVEYFDKDERLNAIRNGEI